MTVVEAKVCKQEMEKTVTDAVLHFELVTGLTVEGFLMRKNQELGRSILTYKVDIDTSLR